MNTENNLFIYNHINYKYQNEILPAIPNIIITYLLTNEDKQKYYVNSKITIKQLLKKINQFYQKNQTTDLLEIIKQIMEEK